MQGNMIKIAIFEQYISLYLETGTR